MPNDQPLQAYYDALQQAFVQLWAGVFSFILSSLGAIVIFIIGWLFALAVEQMVAQTLKVLRFKHALDKLGWSDLLARVDQKFDAARFVASLVRWFVVLVFLLAAADILKLSAFTDFLRDVLVYIPNIVIAALVLLVAALVSDIADRVVVGAVRAAGFGYAKFVGGVAKWSILVFAVLAALTQLGVAPQLLQTFFTGLVAMVAIAGGLAFGMGGKDFAADVLMGVKNRLSERE